MKYYFVNIYEFNVLVADSKTKKIIIRYQLALISRASVEVSDILVRTLGFLGLLFSSCRLGFDESLLPAWERSKVCLLR